LNETAKLNRKKIINKYLIKKIESCFESGIKSINLGTENWDPLFKSFKDYSDIDKLAMDHLNQFWGRYGLEIPYKIEHKIENISTHLFYTKKHIIRCVH
jgi:hypothetical protein